MSNMNISKQNYEQSLKNVSQYSSDNYKNIIPESKITTAKIYNYKADYNRKHFERYLFDKNVNSIVQKYNDNQKDKVTKPFLKENELYCEVKNSKISSFSESSQYFENLYKSELEKNISDMVNIRRVKSMRNIDIENSKLNKINNTNYILGKMNIEDKKYFDKTTYCQPAVRYNQEFIFKMIEKNNKLKKIVKNLLEARQQEIQNVSWKNYINELKNRHNSYCNDSRSSVSIPDYKNQIDSKTIEDIRDTTFSWEPSLPCSDLSKDLFGTNNMFQHPQCIKSHDKHMAHSSNGKYVPFKNNLISYPTCSQGRLILLEREKERLENEIKRRKTFNQNTSNTFLKQSKLVKKSISINACLNNNIANHVSTSIQTEFNVLPANKMKNVVCYSKSISAKDDVRDIWENTGLNKNQASLIHIGTKLEMLIDSINKFINEVKNRNVVENKCVSVSCKFDHKNKKLNKKKSTSVGPTRIEYATHDLTTERSIGTYGIMSKVNYVISKDFLNKASGQSINKKEISKYSENFGALVNRSKCSAQIQFEIPTKDCCTEVTKSLPRQVADDKNDLEEIITPTLEPSDQITIAINTDPLSVFSLLRISTEAILNFLSFVPSISYFGYLSMLQLPKVLKREENSNVCKICGAAFNKPSELSDHIQSHNLKKTRDCCICRHVLDKPRWPACYFTCQYCGQKFTRAYCCELHEQTCAIQLGKRHDVSANLSTLK